MDRQLPVKPALPAPDQYTKRWKAAKLKFKATTGAKKPAPIYVKNFTAFGTKIAGVEKRLGTGIESALKTAEAALPKAFQGPKGVQVYDAALLALDTKTTEYLHLLEVEIHNAPPGVDGATWNAAVLALKTELRRIKLEMKAYRDKATQSESKRAAIAKTTETLMHTMAVNIDKAQAWIAQARKETTPNDYNSTGNTLARNITQALMNLHKLPITIDFQHDHDRGPVPDAVEDALEAYANGRRNFPTNQPLDPAAYKHQLDLYEAALNGLEKWYKS
jgi:hypothetical protein